MPLFKIMYNLNLLQENDGQNSEPNAWLTHTLNSLAHEQTPEGSSTTAVIDQWLSAFFTNSDFFLINKNLDQKRIRSHLRKLLKQARSIELNIENSKTTSKPKFRFIDLFAGIGGFHLASSRAKGVCVFASEFDPYAQATYLRNFGIKPFGDIKNIEPGSIPSHDILLAGFPCQPFSYAGKTQGFSDRARGTLFFNIAEIIMAKKPKAVLLENVKGFKSHENGKTMETALEILRGLGYSVHWKILNSWDFGLPQFRERWFCVAFREKTDFEFPEGNARGTTLREIIDPRENDVRLKLPKQEIDRIERHFRHATPKQPRVQHSNSQYQPSTKKGRHGVFSFQKADGSLRFHIGDEAKTQIQEAFYACLDTFSPTIIANRTPKLWDLQRKLSVREAAKLQGFPDNFVFDVSDNQAYKQLGNAVSVPVVEGILREVLRKI